MSCWHLQSYQDSRCLAPFIVLGGGFKFWRYLWCAFRGLLRCPLLQNTFCGLGSSSMFVSPYAERCKYDFCQMSQTYLSLCALLAFLFIYLFFWKKTGLQVSKGPCRNLGTAYWVPAPHLPRPCIGLDLHQDCHVMLQTIFQNVWPWLLRL